MEKENTPYHYGEGDNFYLLTWPIVYFALRFFNIIFAWLGMIDFMLPLMFAIFGGNKYFCNHLCGRGQLFTFLPEKFKCS